jgi:hypothetical protein
MNGDQALRLGRAFCVRVSSRVISPCRNLKLLRKFAAVKSSPSDHLFALEREECPRVLVRPPLQLYIAPVMRSLTVGLWNYGDLLEVGARGHEYLSEYSKYCILAKSWLPWGRQRGSVLPLCHRDEESAGKIPPVSKRDVIHTKSLF